MTFSNRSGSNNDELRRSLNAGDIEIEPSPEIGAGEVSEGRIFGLSAGERMILSIILFLAVSVLGVALLFATNTIVLR